MMFYGFLFIYVFIEFIQSKLFNIFVKYFIYLELFIID